MLHCNIKDFVEKYKHANTTLPGMIVVPSLSWHRTVTRYRVSGASSLRGLNRIVLRCPELKHHIFILNILNSITHI